MKNLLKLNVTKPCTERFSDFAPTQKGGYCDSCSKEVIDFTKMKGETIAKFFQNNTGNTCGIFKNNQLKTYHPERHFSFIGKLGIACLTLLSFGNINAQNTDTTKAQTSISQEVSEFTVKGNVKEGDLVAPGVNIVLQGTSIGTVTDFDGNFVFPRKLKKGDILIFSYVGYKSQRVVIRDQKTASNVNLKLDMELDQVIIMGEVSTKKIYKSRN